MDKHQRTGKKSHQNRGGSSILLSILCLLSFGDRLKAGRNTGADFLKLNTSARASGLGEAYTALAKEVDSLNRNPAGIVKIPFQKNRPRAALSFSHQSHFADTNLDYLGMVFSGGEERRRSTWGLEMTRLSYPSQDRRTEERKKVGTFGANDMALGLALAHDFGGYQMGSQVKFIRLEIDGEVAQGEALDVGFLGGTPFPRLWWGASFRNLGPSMKFLDEGFRLPVTLSLGAAYQVAPPLVLAFDVHSQPNQHQVLFSFGSELLTSKTVALRAGYIGKAVQAIQNNQKSESNRGNMGGISGLNAGLGLQFGQFSLDYSISPFGELGTIQALTLATYFGGGFAKEKGSGFESQKESDRVIVIFEFPGREERWWGGLKP